MDLNGIKLHFAKGLKWTLDIKSMMQNRPKWTAGFKIGGLVSSAQLGQSDLVQF